MRIFFDTNVLVASFISRGQCAELFEYCLASHSICLTAFVLDEFKRVLSRQKFPPTLIDDAVNLLVANALPVKATKLAAPACRDEDDDAILAGALEAKADCIVTGDQDLLVLEAYQGIEILKPADFRRFERDRRG